VLPAQLRTKQALRVGAVWNNKGQKIRVGPLPNRNLLILQRFPAIAKTSGNKVEES